MHYKEFIRSFQHGFSNGKSCLTNLINFHEEMIGLVDEGTTVDIVNMDFNKANGIVSHKVSL